MFAKLKEDNKHKINEFSKELDFISNPRIRNITEIAICYIHPLFFEVEASSSGKYHPIYGCGKRGLLRHTRAAVNIAQLLRDINSLSLSDMEFDIAISALILHDSCKKGVHFEYEHTQHDHPLLVSSLIPPRTFFDEDLEYWNEICNVISTHMGQWATSERSTITLPTPKTNIQKFVHEADYLSSRKNISIRNIWNDNDLKIIEEEEQKEKNKATEEKMTEAQEKYIKSLVNEYRDSCNKLSIPCSYTSNNFSYLTKKTAGGFIAKLKKLIENNKLELAKRC